MKLRSILWLGLDRFLTTPARRWTARLVFWGGFLLLLFPYLLSRVITEPPGEATSTETPAVHGLKYETFTVTSFDGTPITGWWVPSIRGVKQPVILFAHGLGASKADYAINADFAAQRGYSYCAFDMRGHGEDPKGLITVGAHESRDIRAVMQWLREKKGVRGFILWGVSLGAASSLLAAAEEPDVDGVVLEACYESMRGTVDRHRKLYFPWIPRQPFIPLTLGWFRLRTGVDPDEIDLIKAAGQLKRGRMLLIVGELDPRAPESVSRLILNASSVPAEIWVMPGIDHDHLGGHPEYENRIAKFLDEVAQSQMLEKKPREKKK